MGLRGVQQQLYPAAKAAVQQEQQQHVHIMHSLQDTELVLRLALILMLMSTLTGTASMLRMTYVCMHACTGKWMDGCWWVGG
jgi:hypothetical protein